MPPNSHKTMSTDQDKAENPTESSAAIAIIAVVTTPAAEQQDHHDDDQNHSYVAPLYRA